MGMILALFEYPGFKMIADKLKNLLPEFCGNLAVDAGASA
jgi:hypothetical protein